MINILPGVNLTTAALNAERVRMEVISQNIANVNTTRGLDGKPYQREHVVFETVLRQAAGDSIGSPQQVIASRIEKDERAPNLVYEPGHPDANSDGMVAMPNINMQQEMVDLIAASRAFEANLAVMKNARSLALQSLAIGKRV
ncbi:MAG: flagellar basal-body rod protein FlgC [Verrucomicrobiota bacterium]|jgi:flagellar basal-body rod protein FlgC